MKHFFTSVLMMLSTLTVVAQYQFANNGFEKWDSNKEPSGWNSYPTAGGKLGGTVKNNEQIDKSTTSHTGSYSAKLMVRDVKILGMHVAYANGMLTSGQISGNSTTASSPENNNKTDTSSVETSMTFTGLPDSMVVWLNSTYKDATQQSRLHVLLHDADNVTDPNTDWSKVVAVAGKNVPTTKGAWQRVSIPFYYKGQSLTIACDDGGKSANKTHTPASTSDRPSYVLATIATNYMAGKGDASDVLLVDDVTMIYNSSLKSLKVNGTAVTGFSKSKYAYTVNSEYKAGCVVAESDGKGATVSVSYNESTCICTVTVKGDDYSSNSSNIHTYTIQFNKPKVYESLLTSLKVNGTSVSNFSSATTSYKVTDAAYKTSKVTYTTSTDATVTESFDASTNVLTLTVKGGDIATNSGNTHVYKVTFHAPFESLLTSLKVNGTSVSNFSSATTSYKVTDAAYKTSKVTYTYSSEATVTESFDASTNVLTLTVKGGDIATNSGNTHVYKVTFHAPFESLLTSLKVNGTSVSNFSSATTSYKVTDAAYKTSKVTYTYSSEATVTESFDASTNVLTLTVKGGDIATNSGNTHVYKVTFHAPFESVLTSLKVNGTSVSNFSSATTSYKVTDAAYKTSKVTYTYSSEATVTESFDASTNVLTLTVKGGDIATNSGNTHVYKVTFHAPFESVLTSLKVNGTSVAKFSSTTYAYTIKDAAYSTSKVEYAYSSDATVTESFDSSTNVLTLTVKGGDIATNSGNTHVYKVTFHAPFESVLTSLKVNGKSVAKFSSSTYSYAVDDAAYATSKVEYLYSSEAMVEENFNATTNILTLTVKGGDFATNSANVHEYKIAFHADFAAYLLSLTVNGKSVATFSAEQFDYTVKDAAFATSDVNYEASSGATVEKSFDEKSNVLTLVVKGADYATNSKNINTYKVTFHAPFGSVLTSLTVNGVSVPKFSSETTSYKIDDASYPSSEVLYTSSEEAVVEKNYDAATNTLTLTVKGGDYATNEKNIHVYKVLFHEAFESYLTSLMLNKKEIDNFSPTTYDYVCPVVYASNMVSYIASNEAKVSENFNEKSNLLTLTVEGGDISTNKENAHQYTIQFYASSYLSDLKIDGKTLKEFDPAKSEYSVDVTYEFSKIEYSAEDPDAVIKESYDEASATLTLTVSGRDAKKFADNVHVYKVHYHMPYSSYLTDLTNNGKQLDQFTSTQYDYVVDEVYARSSIQYVADEFTTVEEQFDSTTHVLRIIVKGGDVDLNPTNVHTYTIQFHAPYGSFLANMKLNGKTLKGFSPGQFEYQVSEVYYNVKLALTADEYASYSMDYDRNTYVLSIRVEAGDIALDPNNYHVYTIQFDDHNVYNSQMLSATINGESLVDFDKDIYAYEIDGSYADIALTYTVDSLTRVEESFDPELNVLTVTVEGGNLDRDPKNYHVYEFTFTEQFEFGAQITAILYDGVPLEDFDKDVYEYTYDLDYNREHFSYTVNSLAEIYEFFDEESLTLSIIVIGGDMDYSNMNEYTIHFSSTSSVMGVENDHINVVYANGTLWLSGVNDGDYALYALNGTILRAGRVNGVSIEVGELPHGIYLVRVNGKTIKVMVGK